MTKCRSLTDVAAAITLALAVSSSAFGSDATATTKPVPPHPPTFQNPNPDNPTPNNPVLVNPVTNNPVANNPVINNPVANNPAPVSDASPSSPVPIFQSDSAVVGVKVTGPLTDLYSSDRTIPEGQKQPSVMGSIEFSDGTRIDNVKIAMRGNSSKRMDQCTFAKLSLSYAMPASGPLAGSTKIKIATHCGETEVPGDTWGRVLNQKEPVREAVIYRILNLAGVVTLRSRLAEITYVDTSANSNPVYFPTGKTLTRHAFFLEDQDAAAARYQGKVVQVGGEAPADPAFSDAVTNGLDPEKVALAIMAQSLTMNGDWYFRMSPSDVSPDLGPTVVNWNVDIIGQSPTGMKALVYDWDITGWVRDTDNGVGNDMQARFSADPQVTSAVVQRAVQDFVRIRPAAEKAIDENFSGIFADEGGRQSAHSFLNSFYDRLSNLN